MCKICTEKIENSHHLIFECVNVQHTWKIVSNIFGFDVKWKHIVIGFYSVRNETTAMYNLLLSFVALKIYKYKMFCRLENIVETSEGIVCNLKLCIQKYLEILHCIGNTRYYSFFKTLLDKL